LKKVDWDLQQAKILTNYEMLGERISIKQRFAVNNIAFIAKNRRF
jgi:hypothetical protein